jgi:hypothetical protein
MAPVSGRIRQDDQGVEDRWHDQMVGSGRDWRDTVSRFVAFHLWANRLIDSSCRRDEVFAIATICYN